jgi:hypothetical protein
MALSRRNTVGNCGFLTVKAWATFSALMTSGSFTNVAVKNEHTPVMSGVGTGVGLWVGGGVGVGVGAKVGIGVGGVGTPAVGAGVGTDGAAVGVFVGVRVPPAVRIPICRPTTSAKVLFVNSMGK